MTTESKIQNLQQIKDLLFEIKGLAANNQLLNSWISTKLLNIESTKIYDDLHALVNLHLVHYVNTELEQVNENLKKLYFEQLRVGG